MLENFVPSNLNNVLFESKKYDYKFVATEYGQLKFYSDIEVLSKIDSNIDVDDEWEVDYAVENGLDVLDLFPDFEENLDKHAKNFNIGTIEETNFDYNIKIKVDSKGKTAKLMNIEFLTEYDRFLCDATFSFDEKRNVITYVLSDVKYDNKPDIELEKGKKSTVWDILRNGVTIDVQILDVLTPYLESYFSAKKFEPELYDNNLFADDEIEGQIEYVINGDAKKSKNQITWKNCTVKDRSWNDYSFDFIMTFMQQGHIEFEIINFKKK